MQGENIDQAETLKYYNCLQFVHYPGSDKTCRRTRIGASTTAIY